MCPHALEEQKKRIAAFLEHQRTGVISTFGSQGIWAMPVWYRSHNFEMECLVPRWADVAHHLAGESKVLLIVQASSGDGLRWLQIQGTAQPVATPDWTSLLPRWISTVQPDALYLVVRIKPSRIDLVDDSVGLGVQETLEW
jgi:hypothetical protein